MTSELSHFAARLREFITERDRSPVAAVGNAEDNSSLQPASSIERSADEDRPPSENKFNALALELFALQFAHNTAYRRICEARGATPETVKHWTRIPAVPASAFKELDLTCLPPDKRTTVFHSSGTTEQRPSRHFHNAESLAVYEASLWSWFRLNVVANLRFTIYDLRVAILTPAPSADRTHPQPLPGGEHVSPARRDATAVPLLGGVRGGFTGATDLRNKKEAVQVPHSSLIHMFEVVRQKLGSPESSFMGKPAGDGSWTVDFQAAIATLLRACERQAPLVLLGTAFSFVHLLDFLAEQNVRLPFPAGSRVMETGGYKGRSRSLSKAELHALITQRLGVPPSHIVCEYGMSELSSQAYDHAMERRPPARRDGVGVQASACSDGTLKRELQRAVPEAGDPSVSRHFSFPPWARVQIISPETGCEVADGETGLIRVFDLANVFSVMAVQTEDLAVRRADEFELIGRAANVEPRGCSLMAV